MEHWQGVNKSALTVVTAAAESLNSVRFAAADRWSNLLNRKSEDKLGKCLRACSLVIAAVGMSVRSKPQ